MLHLMSLLAAFNAHPFLKGRWALKGGTALNLFVLQLPRLSVDIDLNYIGSVDRDTMLAERPRVEEAIRKAVAREGHSVRRSSSSHAGGKWQLRYDAVSGQGGNLEVDVSYMFRRPLWPVQEVDSHMLGTRRTTGTPVLDLHELAAGKLAALFDRTQARDVLDVHHLLTATRLDTARLRTGFVVYGAMSLTDWQAVSIDGLAIDEDDVAQQLVPVLHPRTLNDHATAPAFGRWLIAECRRALTRVLPLRASELEFVRRVKDEGVIDAALVTDDADLRDVISEHPNLRWSAQRRQR